MRKLIWVLLSFIITVLQQPAINLQGLSLPPAASCVHACPCMTPAPWMHVHAGWYPSGQLGQPSRHAIQKSLHRSPVPPLQRAGCAVRAACLGTLAR